MFQSVPLPIIRNPLTVQLARLCVIRLEDSLEAVFKHTRPKCTVNGLLMMGRGTTRKM